MAIAREAGGAEAKARLRDQSEEQLTDLRLHPGSVRLRDVA